MEADVHNFRVICQSCGKIGIIDFSTSSKETGWVVDCYAPGWREDRWQHFEYYLCIDCVDKYDEEAEKGENKMEAMEADIRNFKVICQFCGKTDIIDFAKLSKESCWVVGWYEIGWEKSGWKGFEYYLCNGSLERVENLVT